MPCVKQDACARQAARRQQLQDGPHRQPFEGHHGGLHGQLRLGDTRDQKEDDLRHRRIDRRRIVGTVDVGVDGAVAQPCQDRVGRQMKVGIDAGALHAAVPDVAVDVRRNRPARHQQEPHDQTDDENSRDHSRAVCAADPPAHNEPRGNHVGYGLQQRDDPGVCIVEAGDPDRSDGRQRQQAGGKRQKRPAKSCPTNTNPHND